MSTPEDLLSEMFKGMGIGQGDKVSKMLSTLVRNTQINMLKQLRREIDNNIKKLSKEGATATEYDSALDPYIILGVTSDANKDEVNRAYRTKAWEAHPDRGGSEQKMLMVNAAYEAIKQFRGWK